MTGRELLFKELRERGLTESQINSKAVAVVLDVIANDGRERYLNAKEVDEEVRRKQTQLKYDIENKRRERSGIEFEIKCREDEKRALESKIKIMKDEFDEYVAAFGKSLEAMETPEQRDRLRAAQIFIDSVEVRTDANNTAYIHGLASLLSGVELKDGLENGLRSMTNKDMKTDNINSLDGLEWF